MDSDLITLGKKGYYLWDLRGEGKSYLITTSKVGVGGYWKELDIPSNEEESEMFAMLNPHFISIFDCQLILDIIKNDPSSCARYAVTSEAGGWY